MSHTLRTYTVAALAPGVYVRSMGLAGDGLQSDIPAAILQVFCDGMGQWAFVPSDRFDGHYFHEEGGHSFCIVQGYWWRR